MTMVSKSGGFRFTVELDIILLRKTLEVNPFRRRKRSISQVWQEIADHVNSHCRVSIDYQKCRVRISNLVTFGKRKTIDSRYRRSSQATDNYRERDILVEKLLELKKSTVKNKFPRNSSRQTRSADADADAEADTDPFCSSSNIENDTISIQNDGNAAAESNESEGSVESEPQVQDANVDTKVSEQSNLNTLAANIVRELRLSRQEITNKQDYLIKLREREIEIHQVKLEMEQELLSGGNKNEVVHTLTDLIKVMKEQIASMREDRAMLMNMIIKALNNK